MLRAVSKSIRRVAVLVRCGGNRLIAIEYSVVLGSRSLASQAEHRVKKLTKPAKESLIKSGLSRDELLAFLDLAIRLSVWNATAGLVFRQPIVLGFRGCGSLIAVFIEQGYFKVQESRR